MNAPLELSTTEKGKFKQLYDAVTRWELTLHSYDSRLRYCYNGAVNLMKHTRKVVPGRFFESTNDNT
jgi:hypothetical protein